MIYENRLCECLTEKNAALPSTVIDPQTHRNYYIIWSVRKEVIIKEDQKEFLDLSLSLFSFLKSVS